MKKYSISILTAGMLWGLMGLFVRSMEGYGISSTGAVTIRCAGGVILFGITIFTRNKHLFCIKLKDLWCFLGSGLCSMLFFTYCYFESMNYIDLSIAAILLYTAPSIVILLSRLVFKEQLTWRKIAAVVMAFAGCCFVSGIGASGGFSLTGLLLGLGAGFGYALYSIFARLAMDRGYHSLTVNFYTCLFAAAGACVVWNPAPSVTAMLSSAACLGLCAATALVSCYLPYLLYTYGLNGVETGKASVMASLEPVVATLVGIFVYQERLTAVKLAGMLLVLGAIMLLNLRVRARELPR